MKGLFGLALIMVSLYALNLQNNKRKIQKANAAKAAIQANMNSKDTVVDLISRQVAGQISVLYYADGVSGFYLEGGIFNSTDVTLNKILINYSVKMNNSKTNSFEGTIEVGPINPQVGLPIKKLVKEYKITPGLSIPFIYSVGLEDLQIVEKKPAAVTKNKIESN